LYFWLKPSSTSFIEIMKKLRISTQSPLTCPFVLISLRMSLSSLLSYFSLGLTSRLKELNLPPFSMMLI